MSRVHVVGRGGEAIPGMTLRGGFRQRNGHSRFGLGTQEARQRRVRHFIGFGLCDGIASLGRARVCVCVCVCVKRNTPPV